MALTKGTVIFATQDSKEGFAEATEWLKAQGHGPKSVRLYRLDGMILAELT